MLENIKRTWSRHCYGRGHCVTPLSNTPPSFAGELCSPYVFSTSWNNDQTPQAMGLYMNQKGIKKAFLIGPNYAVGRDMLAGLRLTFQGEVLGQEMTRWPDSSIFRPSFPRPARRSPDAIFAFYPGRRQRAVRHPVRAVGPQGTEGDYVLHRSRPSSRTIRTVFLRPLPDEIGAPFQLPDRAEAVMSRRRLAARRAGDGANSVVARCCIPSSNASMACSFRLGMLTRVGTSNREMVGRSASISSFFTRWCSASARRSPASPA